ncbi:uncharacterized protein LOC142785278 [Rhipicephalus microplus]|uniref:uncharacterized protein LOC142785278 n=1 Tax=Rhipicephalus microplus TaxID=6941 RepID=UPI003F6C2848
MTVTNPFVFIVQLSIGLLASVGDVRAMPARLPGYAPDTGFVNFHVTEITCPAPWDCQPRSVTRTTCEDLRHQHPAPPHSAPISSLPPRSASIGHGGTGEMTVTNPFVFIVQLSIGLLASVGDVRAMPARLPGYAPDTGFVNFHVTEITCPAPWDCQPRSVTRTTCEDLRHQHPAPPHSAPIGSLPPRSASIGHGGTGEMTVTNPFVFIVQALLEVRESRRLQRQSDYRPSCRRYSHGNLEESDPRQPCTFALLLP